MSNCESVPQTKFPPQSARQLEAVQDRLSDSPVEHSPSRGLRAKIRQLAIAANTPLCAISSRQIPPRAPFSFLMTRNAAGKSQGRHCVAATAAVDGPDTRTLTHLASRAPDLGPTAIPGSEKGTLQ
jgi:hypothetical protein